MLLMCSTHSPTKRRREGGGGGGGRRGEQGILPRGPQTLKDF